MERCYAEEEALSPAHDTPYGLSAGFRISDSVRMEGVSRKFRFGTVWINDFNVYFVQAPRGGFKQSGMGRELIRAGLEEYTEIKHIF